MRFKDLLPEHLAHALRGPLDNLMVFERAVDCDRCSCSERSPASPGYRRSDMKCCTFWPFVPNFLVGRWLELAKGRIELLISSRSFILPIGLCAPPAYQRLFNRMGESGQGRSAELLCPMFDRASLRCSVWSARPGECLSHFCQSEQGPLGLDFWRKQRGLGNFIEQGLAQWAMLEHGFNWSEVEAQLAMVQRDEASPGGDQWQLSRDEFLSLWAENADDPAGYFRRCWQWFQGLSAEQVRGLLGEGPLGARVDAVREAHELTSWPR